MKLKPSIFLLALAMLIVGCAHYPVNARLSTVNPRAGYRFQNSVPQTNSDDLLLILAFSGGGMRAAALSYGVLEQLKHSEVGAPMNQHPLLDDVSLISSVSGGSFTAAYYALWGDRIFEDFESHFLKKRVQTGLLLQVLAPWNQIRLASPKFDRSDLAAEYYDHLLFKGATFGDLETNPHRPFLNLNATDIGSGARFEFTQDEFDLLRSDISQFPISRAVAASSAFPVYLTPVVLKNYSAGRPSPEPNWTRSILEDPGASSRMKFVATQAESYTDEHRRFVHLLDGGLSDNLGLRGALDRAIAREQFAELPSVPAKLPRRVAIVVVDAHTDSDYGWNSKERYLGLGAIVGSVGQVSVSHYSFETLELFREVMGRLSRERAGSGDAQSPEIATYVIELQFSQLANNSDREFFNSVPTSLQLPSKTVDRLRELAAQELADNKDFKRLLRDLGSDSPQTLDQASARTTAPLSRGNSTEP
jgi:NTE family protein